MFAKIQKLKNKKGFTLVELIVVIAIIAVLAAILVPLMSDYLTKARVSSAASGAKSIKNVSTYWLTDLNQNGIGFSGAVTLKLEFKAKGALSAADITVTPTASITGIPSGKSIVDYYPSLVTSLNNAITTEGKAIVMFDGNSVLGGAFSTTSTAADTAMTTAINNRESTTSSGVIIGVA